MSLEPAQLTFDDQLAEPHAKPPAKPRAIFAGLSPIQFGGALLVLLALIWGMWATRELTQLDAHRIVSVRLGELVNQFALAEARSGDEPDKVTARTRAYMTALDKALKRRSDKGQVVLVGEAIVASSSEDVTTAVAAEVARSVPMPVAQALPPRQPVAPVMSGTAGSIGVAQDMSGAIGEAGSPPVRSTNSAAVSRPGQAGGIEGSGDGQP